MRVAETDAAEIRGQSNLAASRVEGFQVKEARLVADWKVAPKVHLRAARLATAMG